MISKQIVELARLHAASQNGQRMKVETIPNPDREGQDNPSAVRFFYFWPNVIYTNYEIPHKGEGIYCPNGILPANFIAAGSTFAYAYLTPDKRPNGNPLSGGTFAYGIDSSIIPLVGGLKVSMPFSRLYVNMNMGLTYGAVYFTAAQMAQVLTTPLILAITRSADMDLENFQLVRNFSTSFLFNLDAVQRFDVLRIPVSVLRSRIRVYTAVAGGIDNPAIFTYYAGSVLMGTTPIIADGNYFFEAEANTTTWEIDLQAGGPGETGTMAVLINLESAA